MNYMLWIDLNKIFSASVRMMMKGVTMHVTLEL